MTGLSEPGPQAIEAVARALGALNERAVYVGGAVIPLLVTDPFVVAFRPTDDVDLVVDVATYGEYAAVQEHLNRHGLSPDSRPGAPVCRWRMPDGAVVDVMPAHPDVIGFSNPWYRAAIETATAVTFPSGVQARILSASAFLATKMTAFRDRSRNDFLASHDLEDIVTVIDGRPALQSEAEQAPENLRAFLTTEARAYLDTAAFREALPGVVDQGPTTAGRVAIVIERLERIAALV